MNTQKAYEMMRVYLTRPGARRAFRAGSRFCSYETVLEGETHRCAVGCLLSPQALAEGVAEFKGGLDEVIDAVQSHDVMERRFPLAVAELADAEFDFLYSAQAIHDNEWNWSDKGFDVSKLDKLAADYGLEVVKEVPTRAPQEAVLV